MKSWNQLPDAALQVGKATIYEHRSAGQAVRSSLLPLALSAAGAHTVWNRTDQLAESLATSLQHFTGLTEDAYNRPFHQLTLWSTGAAGYLIVAYLMLLGLSRILLFWRKAAPAPKWEKSLGQRQRALFGLPSQPVRVVKQLQPAADASPSSPYGPPLRHEKPIPSSWASPQSTTPPLRSRLSGSVETTPPGGLFPRSSSHMLPRTPPSGMVGTPGSGRGSLAPPSPYSPTTVVSTPEAIQPYLDAVDEGFSPSDQASPGLAQQPSYASPGYAGSPYNAGSAPLMGTHALGSAPRYQPSLQPRGKTSPIRGDGALLPSSQAAIDALLVRLRCDRRSLDDWTERLREWFALHVLRELTRKMAASHKEVMDLAAKIGATALRLDPLDSIDGRGGGPGYDLSQLRQQLTGALSANGGIQTAQTPMYYACLEAVNTHQRLDAFLSGDQPHYMMPSVPRGYIVKRIVELAKVSCMGEFIWNGGGEWGGRPWSPDLPTDSTLLLYIFSAYLQAPKWKFPLDVPTDNPPGATPLLFGSLPMRPPDSFDAVLSVRPASFPARGNAILALGLASKEPHFTLVLFGGITITMCNYVAVFHIILLFLQHAKLETDGMIGGRSLDYLRLAPVLRPAASLYSLLPAKWLWY